jgi:hypothetical protein
MPIPMRHWNSMLDQSATEYSGTININGGQRYSLRMEYYENSGVAVTRLSWSSSLQATELIPQSRLYSEGQQPENIGDVNNDGNINIVDALLVAQYYVGLNPSNFDSTRADANCNGSINSVDTLLIAQYNVGTYVSDIVDALLIAQYY